MHTFFGVDSTLIFLAMRLSLTVISAWIADIQNTGGCSGVAILGFWIPAFPAGTTCFSFFNGIIRLIWDYLCIRPKCVRRLARRGKEFFEFLEIPFSYSDKN